MGEYGKGNKNSEALSRKWLFPPFTVLRGRGGPWRKDLWLAKGLCDETRATIGLNTNDMGSFIGSSTPKHRESRFFPVLAEVVYEWFCPRKGAVLDPFCGGPVRGLVASATGRKYTGLDIRKEQVAANKRAKRHLPGPALKWLALDATEIASVQRGKKFDLVFTCPPFFEMERYSELERDLSTMAPEDFQQAYAAILVAAATRLANHRFMVIITGDVRGEDGGLLNLFEQAREAICGAGLKAWNTAIFLPPLGSLPLRTSASFKAGRKMGRAHQYVQIFLKGCPEQARLVMPTEAQDVLANTA